jgi:cytochrome P450
MAKRSAPGPKGKPLLGSAADMQSDALGFLTSLARDYGDVAGFKLGPQQAFAVFHPDHVKHVLADNNANYQKPARMKEATRQVLGNGLLTAEGEVWKRQRRIVNPVFHKQRIAGLAETMVAYATRALDDWRSRASGGAAVDVAMGIQRLTERIAGKTLLDMELGGEADEIAPAIRAASEIAIRRIAAALPIPEFLPTPSNRRFKSAVATFDRIILKVIADRRRKPGGHNDLLAMLLDARDDETNERMTDAQLRDEVMTIYLAGQETTANALTWLLLLLSRFPMVQREARAEVVRVLGDRPPGVEDLPRLELVGRIINETLRLYPPAYIVSRQAIADDDIGGYPVPAGSIVFTVPYVTHRDPRFWEHPEGFDPDHFARDRVKERPKYAHFPFGGGQRLCIGTGFAMMEMQIIVAMLLGTFSLHLAPGARLEPQPLFTLQPSGALPMLLRPVDA